MASRNITGKESHFGNSRGPPVYKISGSMYHLSPNVLPEPGVEPNFEQIYMYDREQQADYRMKHCQRNKEIDRGLLMNLQDLLRECNLYIQQYQMAAQVFQARPTENLCLRIKSKGSRDVRRNTLLPDICDVVVIAPGKRIFVLVFWQFLVKKEGEGWGG